MLKAYAIRLKFGITIKDLRFQAEDSEEMKQKWEEACSTLDKVGDSCTEATEFFEKASLHYVKYGFERIAK